VVAADALQLLKLRMEMNLFWENPHARELHFVRGPWLGAVKWPFAGVANGEGVHYLLFGFINIRLNYLRRMWLIKIKRRNGQSGNSRK
jgi:hypothetical protein